MIQQALLSQQQAIIESRFNETITYPTKDCTTQLKNSFEW